MTWSRSFPCPASAATASSLRCRPAESAREYESAAAVAAAAESALRQRSGVAMRRIGEPLWASAFRIQRRLADRYREGSVFLAGDAAHVYSPVGGQGMNTGIQDAFNLGWKLALAARGLAAPGLLDTYEAERRPVARGVLRGTDLATRLVLARNPVVEAVREYAVPALAGLPPVRRRFLATLSQLNVGYRGAFLSVDADASRGVRDAWRRAGGIEAGDRVPDAPLRDGASGEDLALFDRIGRGWALLLFAGEHPSPEQFGRLARLASGAREAVGDEAHAYAVLGAASAEAPPVPALIDPTGALARRFGANRGLAALVRPDGYLGYRGRLDQQGELASYLARVFAMRIRDGAGGATA